MQSLSYRKMVTLLAIAAGFFLLANNFKMFLAVILSVIAVFKPFFIGFAIAFVLNLLIKFIENKLFIKMKGNFWRKLKRPLSMLICYVFAGVVIYFVISIIMPQLVISVNSLVDTIAAFINQFDVYFENIMSYLNLSPEIMGDIQGIAKDWILKFIELLKNGLPGILDFTMVITNSIVNFILALVFSVYMLANKERLLTQCKKVLYAYVPETKANRVMEIVQMSNDTFGKFVSGQLMEAVIISVLCFVGMLILRLPYALLISVIIGITALIPVFGALIGTIPCAFIILMINPISAVIFVIFIIVLQQFEGNVIYPKVVGGSIGLSGIWVLLALIVGGGLFGFKGILLGIPLFAVFYKLFKEEVNKRISKKQLGYEIDVE